MNEAGEEAKSSASLLATLQRILDDEGPAALFKGVQVSLSQILAGSSREKPCLLALRKGRGAVWGAAAGAVAVAGRDCLLRVSAPPSQLPPLPSLLSQPFPPFFPLCPACFLSFNLVECLSSAPTRYAVLHTDAQTDSARISNTNPHSQTYRLIAPSSRAGRPGTLLRPAAPCGRQHASRQNSADGRALSEAVALR
eukprot:116487-Rhodomonas_salina.6